MDTHGLLLGCRLLLRSGLLLGRRLLLGCRLLLGSRLLLWCDLLGLGGGLFEISAELVGALDLGKVAIRHGLLQGVQEHGVEPLLVGGEAGLHVLLDGDGGRAVAVLEGSDGLDDLCFVRHGDDWVVDVGVVGTVVNMDGSLPMQTQTVVRNEITKRKRRKKSSKSFTTATIVQNPEYQRH